MDGEFELNLDDVMKNIDTAEVMSVFFPRFRKAVVIDTRFNEREGPMVRIMPMAASPQERLRSIRRQRINFPRLHNMTVIPWPRYVESLVSLGVWDRVVRRFRGAGQEETVATCNTVLAELRLLEKAEMAAVVIGENFHTIWSAQG
ncbi:MAG: hypothetical protein QF467_02995 [SAR202 cluster bacterium]|jgi:hypothetical protein|nr:hypothetical protein [SAR202 cluster bacterium]|tara:strand:- start:140 stop:577 length:438 start_codon:yes stop_codon:yes gene_type:complete